MKNFKKVIEIGMKKTYGGRNYRVHIEIVYKDNELTIQGVEGALASGNCLGACGQIDMHFNTSDLVKINPAWTESTINKLMDIWDKYHMKSDIPQDVLDWLYALPETGHYPAWI